MLHPTYPITTNRLILRPYEDDDLAVFYDMNRRPDVVRYLYWGVTTREEAAAMVARRKKRVHLDAEGDAITLAVTLRESGILVGEVTLGWPSQAHQQGEIGFIFHPDHHGKGYAHEASRVMLRLGFEEMKLHRIVGRCEARNTASARLMTRLGMRREAHLVENEWVKGEWSDELIYAMLDGEWAATNGS